MGSHNDDWRNSPIGQNRSCTDILFLLLLISSWVAMTAVGLVATGLIESEHLPKGDPIRLTNGMDYLGNICGYSNGTIHSPKAYFLPSGTICVESCPSVNDINTYYCKYDVEEFINEKVKTVQITSGEFAANQTRESLYLYFATSEQCMPQVSTTAYLGYCMPGLASGLPKDTQENSNSTDDSNLIVQKSAANGEFYDQAMADAFLTRYAIVGFGFGFAMISGFSFLLMIRSPGVLSILIWSVVAVILGALGAGGYYMKQTSLRWEEDGLKEDHEIKGMFWLSIVSYTGCGLLFLTVIAVRKRIILAISCVKEASKAIAAMPVMILYPVLQVLGFLAFLIPWAVFMLYIASSGEMHAECVCKNEEESNWYNDTFHNNTYDIGMELSESLVICNDHCTLYKTFEYGENTKYAGLYLMFTFFWTSQFITAIGQVCIAMAISMWYFSRDKGKVGNKTFLKAICLSCFYHLGTCAFGSLIIAIIKTARTILTYLERKAAKAKNPIAQVCFKSLQCCMCLLEKCLKFVNKNAYIQTAIHGYSFCKGAKEAFFLILRNVLRISAVSLVSNIVMLLGKLFIIVTSTLSGYLYMDYYYADQLNGLSVVTITIFISSYATAGMFNEVFGMAISTILQCFVTDEELFEPDDRYAEGSLVNTIDDTTKSTNESKIVYPTVKITTAKIERK